MSTAVEIDGVALLPIKEASKRVAYSRDYVARLAREGKIVASQIGRQWYVDPLSLERYRQESALVEELQKQALSDERKREREAVVALKSIELATLDTIQRDRTPALMSTLAVLMVGLVTGGMFYSFSVFYGVPAGILDSNIAIVKPALNQAVDSVESEVVTSLPVEPLPTLLYTAEDEVVVKEEVVPLEDASGVLLLARNKQADNPEVIAELFSDPVEVEFQGDGSGSVRYERADGTVVEVPFVRVPAANSTVTE